MLKAVDMAMGGLGLVMGGFGLKTDGGSPKHAAAMYRRRKNDSDFRVRDGGDGSSSADVATWGESELERGLRALALASGDGTSL